jgi:hypothetical protein
VVVEICLLRPEGAILLLLILCRNSNFARRLWYRLACRRRWCCTTWQTYGCGLVISSRQQCWRFNVRLNQWSNRMALLRPSSLPDAVDLRAPASPAKQCLTALKHSVDGVLPQGSNRYEQAAALAYAHLYFRAKWVRCAGRGSMFETVSLSTTQKPSQHEVTVTTMRCRI